MFEHQEKPCKPEIGETCPTTGYQTANVCVPVSVKPFAKPGKPVTYCCGDPVVCSEITKCPGSTNARCDFTISQKLCIKVPVEFGAYTSIGETYIAAGEASNKDLCCGCKPIKFELD